MRTVPDILHTLWCDPAQHDDCGITSHTDQWCRSSVWTYETCSSTPNDRDAISISIERYASRPGAVGPWQETPARIYMEVARENGVDLLPHELNIVMQRMLQAQAVANGTAVTW